MAEGGDVDLHTHRTHCKMNPGYREFIPIESFSLKHLPKDHQDMDLYKCIKAVADLTVRISVNMTSPDRPEFWPNTNTKTPYFSSDMRGKKTMRAGTGWVKELEKFTDIDPYRKYCYTTCPCDKGKTSDNPSKAWWKINVETAAHVVFDDVEASHTTISLFYDREDSPLVILKDEVCVDYVDIEKDMSQLTCVTCDKNLGNKLEKMVGDLYFFLDMRVSLKHGHPRDIHKFNFIVSHPHGFSKQVSVGQRKDKVKVAWNYHAKFTCTTCTCPGSSGEYVYCVGYGSDHYFNVVQSGTLKSALSGQVQLCNKV